MIIKITLLTLIVSSCVLTSCNDKKQKITNEITLPKFQNKAHKLIYNMVEKVGNYQKIRSKKDVVYTYTYKTPDGKINISTEKYIFDGELSYGRYTQHQRTLPQLNGVIEQGYDGKEYWLKHNGVLVNDTTLLKRVAFNRPTNFYWFTMFQKLLDPGLNYEYLGEKNNYYIVKISFESRNEKPTDIYQLYINKESGLVDQFLFTVADFGKMEIPNLMQLEYEKIDGFFIPSKRRYKKSNWNADTTSEAWTSSSWTNINFNTGIIEKDFKK